MRKIPFQFSHNEITFFYASSTLLYNDECTDGVFKKGKVLSLHLMEAKDRLTDP